MQNELLSDIYNIRFRQINIPVCIYPHGVIVKAMDCGIVVGEFVLQLPYYVHFRANTFGTGTNPLILPVMG